MGDCALTAAALPEGQPYPRLFEGLDGLLGAIEAAPSARGWAAALVRYEYAGARPSRLRPRRAAAGHGRIARPGLGDDPRRPAAGPAHSLERDLLTGRQAEVLAARERLVERLKRVGG